MNQECYDHNSACLARAEYTRRLNKEAFLQGYPQYNSPEYWAAGFTWEGPCICGLTSMQADDSDTYFDPDDLPTTERQGENNDH
jgi:hypothetical protein